MKIQLDTDAKTIKIEGTVSVGEFLKKIKALLPTDWQDYKLETNTVIHNWSTPIIIERGPRPLWDWFHYSTGVPIGTGQLTTSNKASTREIPQLTGTYNLEV